jgi:hypothetical protein
MRTLLAVSIALSFALGCSKSKGDYTKACEHLLELAHKDLEASLASMPEDMREKMADLKDKAEAQRGSDLATCVAKSEEHDVDTSCILKADKLDDAQGCLARR